MSINESSKMSEPGKVVLIPAETLSVNQGPIISIRGYLIMKSTLVHWRRFTNTKNKTKLKQFKTCIANNFHLKPSPCSIEAKLCPLDRPWNL